MYEDIIVRYHKISNKSLIAIFTYIGQDDPVSKLNSVVYNFTNNNSYNEYIDSHLDNPWMRVIIIGINEMKQEKYNPELHKVNDN